MTSEIHDALRDAQGVPEDEARRAAEVVVGFGDRLAAINTKLAVSDGKLDGVVRQLDFRADMPRRMVRLEGMSSSQPSVWQMITFIAARQATLLGLAFLRYAVK